MRYISCLFFFAVISCSEGHMLKPLNLAGALGLSHVLATGKKHWICLGAHQALPPHTRTPCLVVGLWADLSYLNWVQLLLIHTHTHTHTQREQPQRWCPSSSHTTYTKKLTNILLIARQHPIFQIQFITRHSRAVISVLCPYIVQLFYNILFLFQTFSFSVYYNFHP